MISSQRPTIPTGNMLTESLMAQAAEERRRKKSVAASIRHLAAEKPKYNQSFYIVLFLLILVTALLVIMVIVYFTQSNSCPMQKVLNKENFNNSDNNNNLNHGTEKWRNSLFIIYISMDFFKEAVIVWPTLTSCSFAVSSQGFQGFFYEKHPIPICISSKWERRWDEQQSFSY